MPLRAPIPALPLQRVALAERIVLADYPQLRLLAWSAPGVSELTPAEALGLYERNWRHLDTEAMEDKERALIAALVAELGGGVLLV